MIQIGNDVFRNGGYCTVDQFMQEYGEKYDVSEINPDGYQKYDQEWKCMITSKDDPDINFEIVCFEHTENPEEETKVRIGDCKIVYFLTTCKACWFPNAIRSNGEGFDCNSIPAYLEEHGFRSVTQEQAGMEYYMNYGMYWDDSSFGSTMYICRESAAEENLYGFHPIYEYQFWYQMDTTKVTLVSCKTHPYFDYGNSGNYTKIS